QVDAHEEPVELALGERVCALELPGDLGRDDHEGLYDGNDPALDGDARLVHSLQHGRLGAWRGAVDLVREHEVGEDRAALELELVRVAVEDRDAQDIAGEHVGRELDSGEAAVERAGEGGGEERLPHSRDILDENMPPG